MYEADHRTKDCVPFVRNNIAYDDFWQEYLFEIRENHGWLKLINLQSANELSSYMNSMKEWMTDDDVRTLKQSIKEKAQRERYEQLNKSQPSQPDQSEILD